jgi:hypothetical protein
MFESVLGVSNPRRFGGLDLLGMEKIEQQRCDPIVEDVTPSFDVPPILPSTRGWASS